MSPRGIPRTDAQRRKRHKKKYGTTKIPKKRKGKNRKL